MNSHRFVRFMRGGHWICKHRRWFKVSEAAYRRHKMAGAVGFCSEVEDWTGERHERSRKGLLVTAFFLALGAVMWYAAGFPL